MNLKFLTLRKQSLQVSVCSALLKYEYFVKNHLHTLLLKAYPLYSSFFTPHAAGCLMTFP